MGENRNFAALDWVTQEIDETLAHAREALEAWANDPNDNSKIRFCLAHIHQVHGSLQMVEFYGAALLAEELELLAQALCDERVQFVAEAQEALMRGILQLPVYLDRIKSKRRDQPAVLLPLLNDLRSVRGENLLSESRLFNPDLSPAQKITQARIEANLEQSQFLAVQTKLQQMYQYAAAAIIRGVKTKENIHYLHKVLARQYKLTTGSPNQALWEVSLALVEALAEQGLELSASIKLLLRQLNRQLKILLRHGVKALDVPCEQELLRNLLFYVAIATSRGRFVAKIRKKYQLDDKLIGDDQGNDATLDHDPAAIRSVVLALKEELRSIKLNLDDCLSSDSTLEYLNESLPVAQRVADTLAILGVGDIRKQMLTQVEALETIVNTGEYTDQQLFNLASDLIDIEGRLDGLTRGVSLARNDIEQQKALQLSIAQEVVLSESRNGLEQTKDCIIEYIASQWDRQHLQNVPKLLREIRGGLDMIPLARAGRVLGACADYIDQQLLVDGVVPEWRNLDTLADAIASIEYYLEHLSGKDNQNNDEMLLAVAEDSVRSLGLLPEEEQPAADTALSEPSPQTPEFSAEQAPEVTAQASTNEPDQPRFENDQATGNLAPENQTSENQETQDQASEDQETQDQETKESPIPEFTSEPEPTVESPALEESFAASEPLAEFPEDDDATIESPIVVETPAADDLTQPSTETADAFAHAEEQPSADQSFEDQSLADQPSIDQLAASQAETADSEDEDLIDEEILEIFIEEAQEVSATIDEFYPRWVENLHDGEALTEFRRAFHTLKGSGRMVGATDIGELAWSIENMLNRVIDKTIEPNNVQVELINRVLQVLPGLIDAFEHRKPNPEPGLCRQYMTWADEIASGVDPEGLISGEAPSVPFDQANPEPAPSEEPESAEPAPETFFTEDEDDDEDSQAILWEIFSGEATGHLATIGEFIAEMDEAAPLYGPPSDAMQRALHTLKGSAHMADVQPIAQLATPLEHFIKELRTYQFLLDEDLLQLIKDGVDYINLVLGQIAEQQPLQIPRLDQYLARIHELRDRTIVPIIRQQDSEEGQVKPVDPELLSIFMAEEMNLLLDADILIDRWRDNQLSDQEISAILQEVQLLKKGASRANLPEMAQLSGLLEQLYNTVIAGHLPTDERLFTVLNHGHDALLDMVDAVAAGQNIPSLSLQLQADIEQLLQSSQDADNEEIIEFDERDGPLPDSEWLGVDTSAGNAQNSFNESVPSMESGQSDFVVLVDEDGSEAPSDNDSNAWQTPEEPHYNEPTGVDAFDSSVEQSSEPDYTDTDINLDDDSEQPPLPDAFVIDEGDASEDLDPDLAEGLLSESPLEETTRDHMAGEPTADTPNEPFSPVLDSTPFESPSSQTDNNWQEPEPTYTPPPTPPAAEDTVSIDDMDVDPEIVEIFAEEASELLEDIDVTVHEWISEWDRSDCVERLKRALHTFKGSARLAGIMGLGEAAHDFETFLIKQGNGELGEAFFETVNAYYELLYQGSEAVQQFLQGQPVAHLSALMTAGGLPLDNNPFIKHDDNDADAEAISDAYAAQPLTPDSPENFGDQPAPSVDQPMDGEAPAEPEFEPVDEATEDPSHPDNVVPFAPRKTIQEAPIHPLTPIKQPDQVNGPPAQSMMGAQVARRGQPAESVKVSAELLEELVNLAGETSISRSRMEEQVNEIGFTIDEMDFTIERLQEQLRRLDIETEAQILFRQEQMQAHDDFDPLEMDRYSQLQQLSRSLMESASDLLDLRVTLSDKTRDTETLLLQQSRINTELQEGLMRSRMVPFSRLVPRLRRIVRQVATELGKRVTLELDNVEGELDRTMLERMIAPLEHMVRNAVDHGIELPDARAASGKSETGTIRLGFNREGSDVVLNLSDDGKGIDIARVRETAIKRGLMIPDAQLSDHDIMQFILTAGFSTAQSVTQISGRGVGMDVVNSEIKQLGGSVTIDSTPGQGTTFDMRLPFTLSVNRALMVAMGDDIYAVPLNSIEGIVRVSPYELEHYYATPDARFEYAGQQYQVRYLGTLLDESYRPQLDGHALPLPVLLVRSQEYSVALQVDSLLGSREIVVKNLGPQFASVEGLSGATVMGDGSVVVILDLLAMVRRLVAQSFTIETKPQDPAHLETPEETDSVRTVMIVDDSVTVRKVTSRFLEREGFNVLTAKDGVDALRQLQDQVPDVMLLDIEMPRMDGFEVAKNIRTSSHLHALPIIMITSRTGSKHRERAYELGVNNYLGKPYQEEELLASIKALTQQAQTSG